MKKFEPIRAYDDDGLIIPDIGTWGQKKYKLVGHYANIFTSAMKNKWNLVYLDLFAGAGYARIKGTKQILGSSSLISLMISNKFDYYIFNELDTEKFRALKKRISRLKEYNESTISIINCNANSDIEEILSHIPRQTGSMRRNLCFCFLDPFSLNLEYKTVEKLAENKMDILLLLALQMDAKRNFEVYLNEQSEKIELLLGNSHWRNDFKAGGYRKQEFVKFLSDQYDVSMKKLGYHTNIPKERIVNTVGQGIYYLAFYSRHELGGEFFNKIRQAADDQLKMF
ncbi:MAG: three-Cys-motif partner protein TcmP [Bacteroidetes bacterium]|nr:three-Cys-motif partner protein TcmP [Bacteroidota bacterium]